MRWFRPLRYLYCLAIPLLLVMTRGICAESPCRPTPNYPSPYLRPYSEVRSPTISWCVSNFTSPRWGEVHLLYLNTTSIPTSTTDIRVVEVTVKPHKTKGGFRSPFVVVLCSDSPVAWKVKTIKVRTSYKNIQFVICQHKNTTISVDNERLERGSVTQQNLPRRLPALAASIKRQFGGITSLSAVPVTDAITVQVGVRGIVEDISQCKITKAGVSPFIRSYRRYPLASEGCSRFTSTVSNNKAVYIMELQPSKSQKESHITLDLMPVDHLTTTKTDIVLILKSSSRTTWRLRSQKVLGALEIRGNGHVVAKEVNTDPVETVTERFPYSGDALIHFIEELDGPIVAYIKLTANVQHVQLLVDESPQHVTEITHGQSAFTNPAETQAAIRQALVVTCTRDSIKLALPQSVAKHYGLTDKDLYMGSDSCPATSNATHYLVTSQSTECNSQSVTRQHQTYLNNFLIVKSTIYNTHQGDEVEGSGMDPVSGSGDNYFLDDGADQTHTDDEDYPLRKTLKIEFECEVTEGKTVTYSMTAFTHGKELPLPATIQKGERIDIRIDSDDSEVYPQLHRVWLSPSPHPTAAPSHTLLQHGCISTDSLRLRQVTSDRWYERLLLSVAVADHYSLSYLHAQVRPCGLRQHSSIPQCLKQKKYCEQQLSTPTTERFMSSYVTLGPFTRSTPITNHSGHPYKIHTHNDPSPKPPPATNQVVIFQGLDSGTVIGISFASFAIGVLLTSVLLCIHKRTSRWRKQDGTHPRWAERSEETTPCSTAPIAPTTA